MIGDMKKLVLMRHATYKRDGSNSDYDYALSSYGEKESKDAANALINIGFKPDLILCSSANRAKQTANIMANCFSLNEEYVLENKALYLCSPDTLLDVLQEVTQGFENILLVAHNPGVSVLTRILSKTDALPSFPPSGFSVFDYESASCQQLRGGFFYLETVYSV